MIPIRHKITGKIIYTHDGDSLIGANLSGKDLRGANLSGTDLRGCIGDGTVIRTAQFVKYVVVSHDDYLAIGCEAHSKQEWIDFTDEQIVEMDNGALEWWKQYRDIVLAFAA